MGRYQIDNSGVGSKITYQLREEIDFDPSVPITKLSEKQITWIYRNNSSNMDSNTTLNEDTLKNIYLKLKNVTITNNPISERKVTFGGDDNEMDGEGRNGFKSGHIITEKDLDIKNAKLLGKGGSGVVFMGKL